MTASGNVNTSATAGFVISPDATGNIIHPQCVCVGEVVIEGSQNIIEERTTIRNLTGNRLVIGDRNHFRVGTELVFTASASDAGEPLRIGNGNRFDPFSKVTSSRSIGSANRVGFRVHCHDELRDNQIVWSATAAARTSSKGVDAAIHEKHIDYLVEVLPKYH
ncbi:hypothetical protein HDV03_000436 [Kappamyces sp. JEL0829]|nr:hypothetical protein HDV03_000436 [Kappamyces sp. JEL0829]